MARQSILLIHRKKFDEAAERLKDARSSLEEMEKHLSRWREIGSTGAVYTAYQEFAEAKILLEYVQSRNIPSPEKISIPGIPYLLGLADVIGEMRRYALDSIRAEDFNAAERALAAMEEIHALLMTIDTAPAITPGLRQKGDSMRRIIEITRGDITTEARRRSLERSLSELRISLGASQHDSNKKKPKSSQEE